MALGDTAHKLELAATRAREANNLLLAGVMALLIASKGHIVSVARGMPSGTRAANMIIMVDTLVAEAQQLEAHITQLEMEGRNFAAFLRGDNTGGGQD